MEGEEEGGGGSNDGGGYGDYGVELYDANSGSAVVVPGEDGWFYDGGPAIEEEEEDVSIVSSALSSSSASMGIFCSGQIPKEEGEMMDEGGMLLTVSRAFLSLALSLGAFLLLVTVGISTIVPISGRIWNGISYLAVATFVCQLPPFLLLDSSHCKSEGVSCSLGRGSFTLMASMVAYLILSAIVQWKDMPEWKDELELWRLMRTSSSASQQQQQQGGKKKKQVAEGPGGPIDLERGATEECDYFADNHNNNEENGNGVLPDNHDAAREQYAVLDEDDDVEAGRDGASLSARRIVSKMPSNITQNGIERMDLLSHDDLIPCTNDTPIVVGQQQPMMQSPSRHHHANKAAALRREDKRRAVTRYLREERLGMDIGRSTVVPSSSSSFGRRRKDRHHHRATPPVAYISIDDSFSVAKDDNNNAVGSDDDDEEDAPVTPGGGSDGRAMATMSTVVNVSPLSSGGIRSVNTEEHGDVDDEERGNGDAIDRAGATTPRRTAKTTSSSGNNNKVAAAVSPMTNCTGLRTVPSADYEGRNDHGATADHRPSAAAAIDFEAIPLASASFGERAFGSDVFGSNDVGGKNAPDDGGGGLSRNFSNEAFGSTDGALGSVSDNYSNAGGGAGEDGDLSRNGDARRHPTEGAASAAASDRSDAGPSRARQRPGKKKKSAASIFPSNSVSSVATNLTSNKSDAGNSAVSSGKRRLLRPPSIFRKRSKDEFAQTDVHVIEDDEDGPIVLSDASKGTNGNGATTATLRLVSPEKDVDPDIAYYQSESSLSALSLSATEYHSTDEEYYRVPASSSSRWSSGDAPGILLSHSADSSAYSAPSAAADDTSSELSEVIAGVNRKLNRHTSGKITPLNRRRRRRRKSSSSACDNSTYSSGYSSHGSLLDEVIEEEDELNLSNEAGKGGRKKKKSSSSSVPAIVDASPSPNKKKNKRGKNRGGSAKKGNGGVGYANLIDDGAPGDEYQDARGVPGDERDMGYESGHASGDKVASEAEESFSSRAARARRNRILSKRQHTQPLENHEAATPPSHSKPLPPSFHIDEPKPIAGAYVATMVEGINNRSPPSTKTNGGGSRIERGGDDTVAWHARKVRMARLRMNRGQAAAMADSGAEDVDATENGPEAKEDDIIRRAQGGGIVSCNSDEDSI